MIIPMVCGTAIDGPFTSDVSSRLASATAGAAENTPAKRFGWTTSPIREKATTISPPTRALIATNRTGDMLQY